MTRTFFCLVFGLLLLSSCTTKNDLSLFFSSENTPQVTLKLNSGINYTGQSTIPVEIITSQELTEMSLSVSAMCSDVFEAYVQQKTVNLPNVEGEHTISVRVKNKDGFTNDCTKAKIVFDKTAPVVSETMTLVNTRSLPDVSPKLNTPVTTDTLSGVAKYELKLVKTAGNTVIKDWTTKDKEALYFDGLTLPDSEVDTYFYMIRATDKVGNVSAEKQSPNFIVGPVVTITGALIYDQDSPMGSATIQLSRASPVSTTVAVKSVSRSAIAGLDFLYPDIIPTEVVIAAGATSADTYFSIMTSTLPGPDKAFDLQVTSTTNAIAGSPSSFTANLVNTNTAITAQAANGYRAVRGAKGHMCGLRTDNKMDCWGAISYANGSTSEQLTAKEVVGATNIVSVAEGYGDHTCYIDSLGDLYCFGNSGYKNLGHNSYTSSTTPIKVPSSNIKKAAVGIYFTCFIDSSDQVQCFGKNDDAELGQPISFSNGIPTVYASITKALDIAAGNKIACAIDEVSGTRSVKCWGKTESASSHVPVTITGLPSDIQSISVNGSITADVRHGCGLSEQGLVYCWGSNFRSRRGLASGAVTWTTANYVGLPVKAVKVQAGTDTSCALGEDKKLYCWGSGLPNATNSHQYQESYVPVQLDNFGDTITDFQLTELASCAVTTSSNIKCWGINSLGEMGNGQTASAMQGTALNVAGSFDKYKQLATGVFTTCALKSNNTVTCWGNNDYGQLGNGSHSTYSRPHYTLPISNVKKVVGQNIHFCALTTGGSVYCWGSNWSGRIGNNATALPTDVVLTPYLIPNTYPNSTAGLPSGIKDISVGYNHSCAVTSEGGVTCWGNNSAGELGHPSIGSAFSYPQMIPSLSTGVESVALGINATCAVKNNATTKQVYCWGWNRNRVLGPSAVALNASTEVPQLIDTITTTKEVKVFISFETACYIHDGTTKCWGYRSTFKGMPANVPDGTYITTPTAIPELAGATDLHLNPYSGCALMSTGKAKCWGTDYSRIFSTSISWIGTPVEPPALQNSQVTAIALGTTYSSAGPIHACAITSLGDLKCWGVSTYGEGHDRFFHQTPQLVLK
ncbi:RCC1 domain-containing protein [Bdellovibrio bacteriovorus]|uniref:RCC1 domain-containing protein n=1 Tax=Bdellovibrio bacteriovorus TaxID=959 RepID=UPI003D029476